MSRVTVFVYYSEQGCVVSRGSSVVTGRFEALYTNVVFCLAKPVPPEIVFRGPASTIALAGKLYLLRHARAKDGYRYNRRVLCVLFVEATSFHPPCLRGALSIPSTPSTGNDITSVTQINHVKIKDGMYYPTTLHRGTDRSIWGKRSTYPVDTQAARTPCYLDAARFLFVCRFPVPRHPER